jgi:hypothetical protein
MRRSQSVHETSVGLFAFLDVLMSTMGSLILVLMIVSPKIHQEKIAKAATEAARDIVKVEPAPAPAPAAMPVVAPPRETIDLNARFAARVAALAAQTDEKQRAADDAERTLAAERERFQEIHADRAELERELAKLRTAKDRTLASVDELSTEGIQVESELAKRGSRLRKIRDQIAHQSTEYQFVAYDGVSGTTRRPILIECVDDHIKFVEEDITLTSAELSGFDNKGVNPLRAGAEALLQYWSAHSAPGDPKPYLLLVVRPSGTLEYYRARNLLERLKAPFGYELLPEDQKLAPPAADPQAVAACRQAINKTIAGRDKVFHDVFATNGNFDPRNPWRSGAGGSRVGLSGGAGGGASGKSGSFAGDPFDLTNDGFPGGAKGTGGGSLVAAGNANAGGAVPAGLGAGGGTAFGAGGMSGGGGGGGGGESADSGSAGFRVNGTGPQGVAAGGGTSNAAGSGAGNSNDTAAQGTSGTGKAGGSSAEAPGLGTVAGGSGSSTGDAATGGGRPQSVTDQSGIELLPPSGSGAGSSGGSTILGERGTPVSSGDPPLAGEAQLAGERDVLPKAQSAAGEAGIGQPTPSEFGSSPSTPIVQSALAGSSLAGAQEGPAPASGAPNTTADSSGQSGPPQAAPMDGAAAADGSSVPGGSPGGSSPATDSGGEAGQSASASVDGANVPSLGHVSQDSDDAPPRPGEHRRWGYSNPQASIGFEHDVTIWIGARAIAVGGQPPVAINQADSTRRLTAIVTSALNREAQTWGRPPDHLYWVPNVKFIVSPGGNLTYERLRPAIEQHGLVSSVDYRLEMESPRQTFQSWVQ